ncbi:hypothetical protein OSTOST_09039, partial [Ostertagia ostertagi]
MSGKMEGTRSVKFESHTVDEDGVPTEVADYLDYFAQMIEKKDVPEIHNLYEQHFPDLTERLFIILYKELYYRQVYARNQRGPSLSHRFESFMNYQDLFSEILSSKDPVSLSLPNFQAFCLYKANPGKRSVDEVDELISIEEAQNAWNIYPVLNILYSLLSKSQINEQLAAIRARRTHVLLGDYHQDFENIENVESDAKGLYNTVPSCLVTLHYFVGFLTYDDAKLWTKAIQTQQQKQKNFQYDVIGKTYDQLFHLLAICLAIQPQRIDESIASNFLSEMCDASQLAERCGDRMSRMGNGDLDEFRLAFQMGCPKFLSPTTVVYEGSNLSKEPLLRQSQAFLEGVEAQMALPVLRGYLKLYTSLPTKKLASFMDVDDKNYDSFLGKLLTYKMVVNELGKDSLASSNDDDEPNTDIDFYVDKDMICIADTKVARRVGEHFIRHMQKLYETQKLLRNSRD